MSTTSASPRKKISILQSFVRVIAGVFTLGLLFMVHGTDDSLPITATVLLTAWILGFALGGWLGGYVYELFTLNLPPQLKGTWQFLFGGAMLLATVLGLLAIYQNWGTGTNDISPLFLYLSFVSGVTLYTVFLRKNR